MFLLLKMCQALNIQQFDWVFTEAGHGKGAPDGVGATAKRMTDSSVSHGGSIHTAADILSLLLESKLQYVFEVFPYNKSVYAHLLKLISHYLDLLFFN
jgi:hypothetical protein